ncbi:hypothetical protein E5161_06970 [Cohnella pontilimi]|uniref:ATP-grasp domain-containing protein n=1 Tax=Cohnella pontilimi TaxID=2564100 RepID=A0A4V5LSD2_9BACL|nr:YheC/YheD family protein [Cohnella pontilimi]TJY42589.1 hypothetical protein E5161_06970 [Cohnella pontilimi]
MYLTNGSSITARPIVGVYLGSGSMSISEIRDHERIQKLVEANKEARTTLTFFTSKDVDFTGRQISGAYFDEADRKWKRNRFPFPDVIYVRGGGSGTDELLKKFDDLGIKRINPIHAFNKGELYNYLSKDKYLRAHLPQTIPVKTMSDVRSTVLKLRKVYVKAVRGRKGLQVMRVDTLPSKSGYLYSYSIIDKLVRRKTHSMDGLLRAVRSFFGDRTLIVQKAIELVRVNNSRLVDFRAEVQRDKNNEIDIVGVCARVGKKYSPITTHSTAYRYEDYLYKLYPRYTSKQIRRLKNKIDDFLRQVYLAVEKNYGRFGEIGIDFALDTKGKLWLIECNAQSAKVSIAKAYGNKSNRVFLNPLLYAKRIAGRSANPPSVPRSQGARGGRSGNPGSRSSYANRSRLNKSTYSNRSSYNNRSTAANPGSLINPGNLNNPSNPLGNWLL